MSLPGGWELVVPVVAVVALLAWVVWRAGSRPRSPALVRDGHGAEAPRGGGEERSTVVTRGYGASALTAALAGLAVFVLLLPYAGNDSDPPECFSLFGYVVPCGLGPEQSHGVGFAVAGALLSAALVALGSAVGGRSSARH